MDNNTARLELFRQAINSQADAEAAEITGQTEEKLAALAKEKSERSLNEALAGIRAEQLRTTAYFKKEMARCDFDMKKALLTRRCELIEEFFGDIRKKLAEFTASPEYTLYLKSAIKTAEDTLGGNAVIYARPADIDEVKRLTELSVEQDGSIEIGGINAGDPQSGLFTDLTLDSRFLQEKAAFTDKAELRL